MPGGLTPDFASQVYTPGTAAHNGQILNVFRPDVLMWGPVCPCILVVNNSGFTSTAIQTVINSSSTGHLYRLLRAGWVIVSMKTTITNQPTVEGGSTIIGGRGLVMRPNNAAYGTNAFLEKDVQLAIQFLRRNSARFGINPNAIFTDGRSGGAQGALWAQLAPNCAGSTGFWAGPSTRPNGCIIRAFAGAWWQASSLGSAYDTAAAAHHYNDATDTDLTTSAGLSVATTLNTATEVSAAQLIGTSPMSVGFNTTQTWYDSAITTRQTAIRTTNAEIKLYSYAAENSAAPLVGTAAIDDGSNTAYTGSYSTGFMTVVHDPWNSYVLREALLEIGVEFSDNFTDSRFVATEILDEYAQDTLTGGSTTAADAAITEELSTDPDDPLQLDIFQWAQAQAGLIAAQNYKSGDSMQAINKVLGK